jgi:Na+/H+-dicarboxylate symporter
MLGVTMIAAPGVPGGAIMAATGILASMLGFNDANVGLMIATYVALDSFGTATNVTGDGAIALVMERLAGPRIGEANENVKGFDGHRAFDPQAYLDEVSKA